MICDDLASALEEILTYSGGAESALHDEYVVERALEALSRYQARPLITYLP